MSATGDIVTAGHCVHPQEIRRDLIIEALLYLEKTKKINSAKEWLEYAVKNWDVEGTSKGSKPETRVRITQPESVGGPVKFNHNAQIIDYKTFNDGDVALLRVSGISGALPLPVATQDPAVGTKLVSIGFPAVEQPASPAFAGAAMPNYGPPPPPPLQQPPNPPGCAHQHNPPGARFCSTCGRPLS